MSDNGAIASWRRSRDAQVAAHVGRRVRDLRLERAVTQEELAAAIGVKRESLSRYESGERAITIALLLDIATAMEQPLTAFLPVQPGEVPLPAPIGEVVAALLERPDLIPSVQDLLAVMREEPS